MPAPQQPLEPGATCSHSDGALTLSNGGEAALPALGADAPGEAARVKQGIGEVHVSVALMEEFLQYAPRLRHAGISLHIQFRSFVLCCWVRTRRASRRT